MVAYLIFARENKRHNVKFLLFSHFYFILVRCVFSRVCANLFCGLIFLAFPLYELDFFLPDSSYWIISMLLYFIYTSK